MRNLQHLAPSWKDLQLCQILHPNLDRCFKNHLLSSFLEKARFADRSRTLVRPPSISGKRGQTFQPHKPLWGPDTGEGAFKAALCSQKRLRGGIRHVSVRASMERGGGSSGAAGM